MKKNKNQKSVTLVKKDILEKFKKILEDAEYWQQRFETSRQLFVKKIMTLKKELTILREDNLKKQDLIKTQEALLASSNAEILDKSRFIAKQEEILKKTLDIIKKIKSPPLVYSIFLKRNADKTADVFSEDSIIRVNVGDDIEPRLKEGCRVLVAGGAIVEVFEDMEKLAGEQVKIKALLPENRVIVVNESTQTMILRVAGQIGKTPKVGDVALADLKLGFIYEIIQDSEASEAALEEVPDVKYEDIGGLDKELEIIKNKIEEPFLRPELFVKYKRDVTKGLVLYGDPGCGKTMLAKAIANSMMKRTVEKFGEKRIVHFFNIKGPELSSKWVGESERMIRELFKKAKDLAKHDLPVVIFFDEADSFLARRGSRISSDANMGYVSQFCTEVDGVEPLSNVIIILATNRIDLLDPAVLRPGRLDFKIRIKQPDRNGAREIFKKYLTPQLPLDKKYYDKKAYPDLNADSNAIVNYLIERTVERIYSETDERNKFLLIEFEKGRTEILRFKDFISGAAIKNIVDRAKDKAIKEESRGGPSGIKLKYLLEGVEEEFRESEDLPSTIEAINEWAKIRGHKEEIINYEFIAGGQSDRDEEDDKIV